MIKRLATAALVAAAVSAAAGVHATSLSNPWRSGGSGGTAYSPGAGINISGSTISSAPMSLIRAAISSSAYTANGSGSAVTVQYDLTLANNVTITLAPGQDGQHAVFYIYQDANGTRTLSWTASRATINWLASGAQPTLSTGADACDLFEFIYLNGAWYEDAYKPDTAPDYVIANSPASLDSLTLSAPLGLDSGGSGTAVPTTVAGLPACANAGKGLVETVTDSTNACVAGNTLAGGGTNVCRVMCNGSAWRIMGSALGAGTAVGWPLTGYFTGQRASFAVNVAVPATSGGTLPTTMTPPADAWGEISWYLGLH